MNVDVCGIFEKRENKADEKIEKCLKVKNKNF